MDRLPRILLAEDDRTLGYILSEYLKMNGLSIHLAQNGQEALDQFLKNEFDLAILDIMMPIMDGFSVAEQIKETSPTFPIIFLTAKALKVDKLKGFKIGADDYIVKPVDEEELVARIHAILNRVQHSNELPKKKNQTYIIGYYIFDTTNRTLELNNIKRQLTERESVLLEVLCKNKGVIIERKKVLKEFWGSYDYFTRKSMDVFIYKLRKYLSDDPRIQIRNVHGKGFVLED